MAGSPWPRTPCCCWQELAGWVGLASGHALGGRLLSQGQGCETGQTGGVLDKVVTIGVAVTIRPSQREWLTKLPGSECWQGDGKIGGKQRRSGFHGCLRLASQERTGQFRDSGAMPSRLDWGSRAVQGIGGVVAIVWRRTKRAGINPALNC